ncbi:MAG: hypothetical protein GY796_26310 [Chloroflexi bacterium]|nr:hypothetical protein [Chloroflexota bacterium]
MLKVKLWGILILLFIGLGAIYYWVASGPAAPPCESLEVPVFYPNGLYTAAIYEGSIVLASPHLGVDRFHQGQSLTINHEGLWIATTKLMRIENEEAFFQYTYRDTRQKEATTCTYQLSLEETTTLPEKDEGFTTHNPDELRPFLLQPEELSGQWVRDSLEERTTDIPEGLSQLSDEIPLEDSMWITFAANTSSKYRLLQDIRVYSTEEDAAAIFEAEYYPDKRFNAVNLPDEVAFQPVSENHILGCTLLPADGRWCYFKEQYGRYIVSIHVPIDGESATLQDWEEMSQKIEEKLISHVDKTQ